MKKIAKEHLALGPYRVLDLTDESGAFCTKILAALGADVIKIEPPGGDPTRSIGPFYHDDPNPEKSLHWFTYNLNKRSITLNIECVTGQKLFKRLAKTADFVVECFRPGYLSSLGLGYSDLSDINGLNGWKGVVFGVFVIILVIVLVFVVYFTVSRLKHKKHLKKDKHPVTSNKSHPKKRGGELFLGRKLN